MAQLDQLGKKRQHIYTKTLHWFSTQSTTSKMTLVILLLLVATIPLITSGAQRPETIKEHAQSVRPASLQVIPGNGKLELGDTFSVTLVLDGGGKTFNAAQASVSASKEFLVTGVSITPDAQNGCHFQFLNQPSPQTPSFVGTYLGGSDAECSVYSLTLTAVATGAGQIHLSNAKLVSNTSNTEITPLILGAGRYVVTNPNHRPIPSISPIRPTIPVSLPVKPTLPGQKSTPEVHMP